MSAAPIRLTSPADIVAAVPHLCGFVPEESLVAISLRGKRIGLTMRFDLNADRLAEELVRRLEYDGATAAVLVVYAESGSWQSLVAAVQEQVDVIEALLVRAGRWTSYTCAEVCCPPDGTPVATAGLLAAVAAFDGRAVLRDRAELVRSLAPAAVPLSLAAAVPVPAEAFRAALGAPAGRLAASLIVSLQERRVRDEVAILALEHDETLLALLLELARQCAAPQDVPVCTLIALVAWLRGDGALANVALDRALQGDPDSTMALLLRTGLDAQLLPSEVRAWLRATRRAVA